MTVIYISDDDYLYTMLSKILFSLSLNVIIPFFNFEGKTSKRGNCAFPFMFNGITFTTCTSYGWHRQWCSHTPDYDKDGQWGECAGEYISFRCMIFLKTVDFDQGRV